MVGLTRARGVVLILGLAGVAVLPADEVTRCDLLAAHPLDPDRITEGVGSSAMDFDQAIAACTAAVSEDPENPRLNYQLGRVYFYDGQTDESMPHLELAAAAGYRQAQFVLGYVYDTGLGGVQIDACKAEALWVLSARAGRLAAMMTYPHHVMRGRFAECEIQATTDEMSDFLARAGERDLDYYQGVLHADLVEDLDRYKENQNECN